MRYTDTMSRNIQVFTSSALSTNTFLLPLAVPASHSNLASQVLFWLEGSFVPNSLLIPLFIWPFLYHLQQRDTDRQYPAFLDYSHNAQRSTHAIYYFSKECQFTVHDNTMGSIDKLDVAKVFSSVLYPSSPALYQLPRRERQPTFNQLQRLDWNAVEQIAALLLHPSRIFFQPNLLVLVLGKLLSDHG